MNEKRWLIIKLVVANLLTVAVVGVAAGASVLVGPFIAPYVKKVDPRAAVVQAKQAVLESRVSAEYGALEYGKKGLILCDTRRKE